MQNTAVLQTTLEKNANAENYIFSVDSFNALFPKINRLALLVLLGRAVKKGILVRMCKGYYLYPKAKYPRGYELYHLASLLRKDCFCYLSLESVLSEVGIISQIPMGTITLMTNGRRGKINCGQFGTIEFIHTKKDINSLAAQLTYDERYRMWRASPKLAYQDMIDTKRPLDLIDEETLHEFI